MGSPIRIRRIMVDTPTDPASVGEPFLHMGDNKFGIYNGTQMLWYPCVDPLKKMMLMNLGQKLSGKDSNGGSTVYIDFDTPNAITFKSSAGTILAQFDSTGASFNNLSIGGPIGGGALNRFIHPGFIPNVFPTTNTIRSGPGKNWLGPNTLMWCQDDGVFSARQTYMAGAGLLTHVASEMNTLTVTVTSRIVNGGIRMWIFDPNTGYYEDSAKNKNRFYISVKGEAGKEGYMRIGRNGAYTVKAITGTGSWRREFIDVPTHTYLADFATGVGSAPYSIDVLWAAEVGIWGLAEPTMQCLDNFSEEIFQYKSLPDRLNSANMLWYEPVGYRMYGQEKEYINLPIPLPKYQEGLIDYTVDTVESTYPVLIENKTHKGFEVHAETPNSTYWKYQPRVIVHGQISDIAY